MLSLRLAILLSLSGVALWGLFSLLENLREPELLRTPKAVVVKGCDPVETDEARRVCPQLLCQKALLDARAVSVQSSFETTLDRRRPEQQLIGGVARVAGAAASRYVCMLEQGKVVSAHTIDAAEFDSLADEEDAWETSP